MKEEGRKRRHELFTCQDRLRHMQLELDVVKEKDAGRKAAQRLRHGPFGGGIEEGSDIENGWDSDSNIPVRPIRKHQASSPIPSSGPSHGSSGRAHNNDEAVFRAISGAQTRGIADRSQVSGEPREPSAAVKATVLKFSTGGSLNASSPARHIEESFQSLDRPPLGM